MDFYYEYKTILYVVATILPVVLCLLHYLAIGPKGAELKSWPRTVRRFTIWDRVVHLLRVLAFVAVAVTGYTMAFGPDSPKSAHIIWGALFAFGAVAALLLWNRHSLLRRGDGEWLVHLGGYFSKKPARLSAGKFNAGQKVFLWLTLALAVALAVSGQRLVVADSETAAFHTWLAVHGILAILTVFVILVHIYLSVFAVPGTWPVLIRGRVAREWLAYHHPDDPALKVAPPTDLRDE